MNTLAKNIVAVIAGIVLGSLVNMGIVTVGPFVVPLPEGADVSTMEKLRESMAMFTPVNFICPFLAHALGTLVGSFIAAKFAATKSLQCGFVVAAFFLLGGIAMVIMVGGPLWFSAADLLLAYFPMGFLGAKLAGAPNRIST